MDISSHGKRSLGQIMVFLVGLWIAVHGLLYIGLEYIENNFRQADATPGTQGVLQILLARQDFMVAFLSISLLVFLIFGVLLWRVLHRSVKNLAFDAKEAKRTGRSKEQIKKQPQDHGVEKTEKTHNDRRLFLHMLSVFQREGRLVDFLAEDLSLYEDEQIGAAVRSIHENCKKVMHKYLAPKSIIDQNEGDDVTVPAGFDPSAIKLTGNVTGDPPFKGVLRHKGWQIAKMELPSLAASQDSKVISPAEVEIA